ncbi:disease resistance At4g27190-like [Olea europaea subsp. europaea]|nr:disease resistance At4g27190-like [Olea europaea subsp. europaea]
MAEGVAFSIVGKLTEYIVDPVLRQIGYLFFFSSNIKNLQDKVQELENERNGVKRLVDAAERKAEIIGEEVSAWLLKVDDLKEKATEVLDSVAGSEMRCLFNRCPNLKSRYLLSKRATKKTIEANKLKKDGKFEKVSYPQPPEQMLNLTHHEGFETRLSTKKKIKEALKDKDISIIGICGMPGVGKTTMAKEIVNEVKVEKLFEKVVFAVVSNNPDINDIQDQLAEVLGLKIEEKTTSVRAGRLRQRLEGNNGKSILVIFDDVWNEIDLGTIGIPSLRDRKGLKIMFTTRIDETCGKMEAQKKFKIELLDKKEGWLLFKDTARISDDETNAELLSIAKEVADECKCLPLALVVVGKALKSNKAAHKWRDALRQLRTCVTNLEGMDESVYKSLSLSYDHLVSNEERDLLLLCSLFAEDESIPIENLVRYAKGLELFQNTETLSQTRDRAKTIADNLQGCHLLQPGEKEDEVKLHDVIRDFCLQMPTTKDKYLVKHAGLIEWPEHDVDESYSAISITFNKLRQLPNGLKYQNVKLLRVICRELEECIISEDFFKDMKELRVLELIGMNIQIPSSIQLLTGLRTLCLIECDIHSQLSMIGSLKKLEILSFYQSLGDQSSIEFTNLCNLRSLDLRFGELSYPLLPGDLSGMKKLEELCLGCYIPIKGEDANILKNVVSELDENGFINLKKLILSEGDFEYLIDATNTIPNGTFGKLESLELINLPKLIEICNGNVPRAVFKPPLFSNLMTVKMDNCKAVTSLFRESVARCLVNLQTLSISFCPMLEEVVSGDARENEVTKTCKKLEFPKLKNVKLDYLIRFKSFTYQSNSSAVHPTLFNQVTFPNMEDLSVSNLGCIVKLLGKEMPITSLHKLRRIKVFNCSQLLTIAESDSIQLLQNLDLLSVGFCNALEVLFDFEDIKVNNDDAENNMLGRLKTLKLYMLPNLVHITRMVPKGICVFQNLTNLEVTGCERLRYLFSPSMANSLVALEELSVWNCEALEEITGTEEEGVEENIVMDAKRNEVIDMLQFPKLKGLHLNSLRNLKSFRSESNNDGILRALFNQVNLPNMEKLTVYGLHCVKLLGKEMPITSLHKLTALKVWKCAKLLTIAESDSIQLLQNLTDLRVVECDALKVLFDFEDIKVTNDDAKNNMLGRLTKLQLYSLPELVHIIRMVSKGICVLQNLTDLRVKECKSLKCLFSPSMASSLVALDILEVSNCASIEEIIGKEEEGTSNIKIVEGMETKIVFPNMKHLVLKNLPSIQMFCSQNYELSFPSMENLTVEQCPNMTKLSPRPLSAPKLSKDTRAC